MEVDYLGIKLLKSTMQSRRGSLKNKATRIRRRSLGRPKKEII